MIAERALEFVKEGSVVGLGTGRAATAFIRALGARVKASLKVRAVPTSRATEKLARELGIPLMELDSVDVTVDGADEVDPALNLIKGYGGALVREKIVAAASKRLVILVDTKKIVPVLGTRGKLPVEVVPFGLATCRRHLRKLGFESTPREVDGKLYVTDNGNHILDVAVSRIPSPAEFERSILEIPGVVGTGLFVRMAHTVLIQDGDKVEVRNQ